MIPTFARIRTPRQTERTRQVLPGLQQGYTVYIHQDDGSVSTHYFTLEGGLIELVPHK